MKTESIPPGDPFGPLSPYIDPYLTQVKEQGYARASLFEQVCALKMLGRWLKRTGRGVWDLNEVLLHNFRRRVLKGGYTKNAGASTLRRLLGMLRRIGATPAAKPAQSSQAEQLMCDYECFLFEERNLASQTVTHLRLVAS